MADSRAADHTPLGLTILALWLLAALAVGASGVLAGVGPPAPQLIIASLTAFALTLALRVSPVNAWVDGLDPRWLLGFHLTRFVGFYFLVLYDRGELPREFALYGGWGDILVATTAALLLLFVERPDTTARRVAYATWSAVGFVDILGVIAMATRAFAADPGSMAALLRLPLSLLPTFVVPLVIATHALLALRLWPAARPRRTWA